jgi:hypothetical protein
LFADCNGVPHDSVLNFDVPSIDKESIVLSVKMANTRKNLVILLIFLLSLLFFLEVNCANAATIYLLSNILLLRNYT